MRHGQVAADLLVERCEGGVQGRELRPRLAIKHRVSKTEPA